MIIIDKLKSLLKRDHTFISKSSIKWYGTKYGGFFLDRALLSTSSNLLSFGIGEDVSFDLAVFEEGNVDIYLFDPTPKAIEFVKKASLIEKFFFYPIGISDKDEKADFFLPKNTQHVSGSLLIHKNVNSKNRITVQLKKLSTIVSELKLPRIDILKMDIEGSEYEVIRNIIAEKIFPKQICVEFHNDFYSDGRKKFKDTLTLLKNNYDTGAISKSGNEYLFIQK